MSSHVNLPVVSDGNKQFQFGICSSQAAVGLCRQQGAQTPEFKASTTEENNDGELDQLECCQQLKHSVTQNKTKFGPAKQGPGWVATCYSYELNMGWAGHISQPTTSVNIRSQAIIIPVMKTTIH